MSLTVYVPTTWTDYADSPDLEALYLNHIEGGIKAVTDELNSFEGVVAAGYQPLSSELTAISGVSSTGYVKRTGAATWSTVASIPQADVTGLVAALATIPALSSTTPAALGTAAVGTGTTAARADHVHQMPTAAQVGAEASLGSSSGIQALFSNGTTRFFQAAPYLDAHTTNFIAKFGSTGAGSVTDSRLRDGGDTNGVWTTVDLGVQAAASNVLTGSGLYVGTAVPGSSAHYWKLILNTSDGLDFWGTGNSVKGTISSAGAWSGSAATLTTGRTIGITGDLTWTSPSFNGSANVTAAGTLASIIVAGGPIGSASVVPVITYDAKGRLTAVSSATITPAAIGAAPATGGTYLPLAGGALTGAVTSSSTYANPTGVWRANAIDATISAFYGAAVASPTDNNWSIQWSNNGGGVGLQASSLGYLKVSGSNVFTWTSSGTTLYGTTTLNALGAGFVRTSSGGVVSSSALAVSDLPSSIQTAQGLTAGQIAIGNGSSGLTSSSGLTFSSGTLTASGSFVSGNSLSRQSNLDSNFAFHGLTSGDTTWANASGVHASAGYTMLSNPSTVYVYIGGSARGTFNSGGLAVVGNVGADSMTTGPFACSGQFKPNKVSVTSSTYTLPTVAVGEELLLLFDVSAVTVSTNSTQVVDYRDANGVFALAGTSSTIGAAGYFGTGATIRASAAKLIGVNSGRARLVF